MNLNEKAPITADIVHGIIKIASNMPEAFTF